MQWLADLARRQRDAKNAHQTVLMRLQIQSSDKLLIAAIKNLDKGQQAYGKAKQVTLVID